MVPRVSEKSIEGGLLPPVHRYMKTEIDVYLNDPDTGLPYEREFTVSDYHTNLQLDYIGISSQGVTGDRYGSYLGGGIGMLFSDMLGNHTLGVDALMQNDFEDIGAQSYYINRDNRMNWGGSISRIPYSSSSIQSGTTAVEIDGEDTTMLRVEQLTEKIFVNKAKGTLLYPFSMFRRAELNFGYTHIGYERKSDQILVYRNRIIDEKSMELETPVPLNLYNIALGFTGDDSFFGFTSPMKGSRYNVEIEQIFGSLQYYNFNADYRRYFFTRHFTLALRLLHYGRYGEDAENDRMPLLFIGYPTLVRGYEGDTFHVSKSSSLNSGQYPELERLVGSKIGIINVEFRLPLAGTEEYGVFANRYLPISLIAFADAGVAWTKDSHPVAKITTNSNERIPVFSTGISTRINLFGFMVGELYYAYPFQHPEEDGHFGFAIAPGW